MQSRKPFTGGQGSQPCDHFCTPVKLSTRELEGVNKREFTSAVPQILAGLSGCSYRCEAERFAGAELSSLLTLVHAFNSLAPSKCDTRKV